MLYDQDRLRRLSQLASELPITSRASGNVQNEPPITGVVAAHNRHARRRAHALAKQTLAKRRRR